MAVDSKSIDDFINVMTKTFSPQKAAGLEAMVRDIMADVTAKNRAQREKLQCRNLKAIDKMLTQLSRHKSNGSSRTSSKNSKTTSTPGSGAS